MREESMPASTTVLVLDAIPPLWTPHLKLDEHVTFADTRHNATQNPPLKV